MINKNDLKDILIVDDTAANLKLLASLLSAHGYKVRPASSGSIALRSVESKLPDLVLLDIRMPEMDGFEVCKRLKSDERTKDIPVIFISAMDDVEDKMKAFSVGGIDYVTKPFEPEEVLARINTHLTIRTLQKDMKEQNLQLKSLMQKQHEQEQIMIQQSRMAAMGEMISAIAHQWRQPLNVLALYIQGIELAYEMEEINEEYVNKIVTDSMKQINFMSSTIDDFRNFFTPNREKENFSIKTVINTTIDLLLSQLKSHYINIEFDGDDCTIFGHPNEFQQVTLNIINNAKDSILEFREINNNDEYQGSIQIKTIKTQTELKLIFIDNGTGIDEEIISKIFEPYFTTKFPQNGTGIGLYMVKEIVGHHYKASVEVHNNLEAGAEFVISIPLDKDNNYHD